MNAMDSSSEVYELLEECIASPGATNAFLAGYRLLYTTSDVWVAIQRLYNNYGDVPKIKEYIWNCLSLWFECYCRLDLSHNRAIANQVFVFASKKFKDKALTSKLKTLFIEKLAVSVPPRLNIPTRSSVFAPLIEYSSSRFNVDDFIKAVGSMSVGLFHSLPLDITIQERKEREEICAFADHIVYHVASHILWPTTPKSRAREIQFFIKAASKLRKGNNYEMAFAVYQGLIHFSVKKLTRTWKRVSNTYLKILGDLDNCFDFRDGFGNYAAETGKLDTPYIPMMQFFFRQLSNAFEGNQGAVDIKVLGKFFHQIAMVQCRKISLPGRALRNIILLPSLSQDKLAELVVIREVQRANSSDSDSFSDCGGISPRDLSDSEMSPRPFGSPRPLIPSLPLSDSGIPTSPRAPSPLQKSTSWREMTENSYKPPNSPRPPSKSRIERTQRMREVKKAYEENKSPNEWTQSQVIQWLEKIDMEQYVTLFGGKGITGNKLVETTSKDLSRLGIEKKSHRRKIIQEIEKLPD